MKSCFYPTYTLCHIIVFPKSILAKCKVKFFRENWSGYSKQNIMSRFAEFVLFSNTAYILCIRNITHVLLTELATYKLTFIWGTFYLLWCHGWDEKITTWHIIYFKYTNIILFPFFLFNGYNISCTNTLIKWANWV